VGRLSTARPAAAGYLDRIGLDPGAPPRPDLDGLATLQRAHLLTVPFENLDIAGAERLSLEEGDILDKIVGRRRGGFCYELNGAFSWLLGQLGFRVDLLEARVAGDDGHYSDPFDHLVLRVWIDGEPWHADVGFGDHALEPFPIAAGVEHHEGGRSWRWVALEPGFLDLDRRAPGADWRPDHRTSLTPRVMNDFLPRCRWQETSPDSHFRQGPMCSRPLDGGGRITLTADELITTLPDGSRTREDLASPETWRAALRANFGVDLLRPAGAPANPARR